MHGEAGALTYHANGNGNFTRSSAAPIFTMHANTPKYDEVLTSNCCKIISRNTFSKIFFVSDTQCVEIESCKRHFRGVRCAETRKV